MDILHDTIRRVEMYAAKAGTTPEYVCRAATGNPRLYERLKNRVEYNRKIAAALNEHMAKNPLSDAAPSREAG